MLGKSRDFIKVYILISDLLRFVNIVNIITMFVFYLTVSFSYVIIILSNLK